eukprot:1137917-Pelagomonas_calceolata.AAC.3
MAKEQLQVYGISSSKHNITWKSNAMAPHSLMPSGEHGATKGLLQAMPSKPGSRCREAKGKEAPEGIIRTDVTLDATGANSMNCCTKHREVLREFPSTPIYKS